MNKRDRPEDVSVLAETLRRMTLSLAGETETTTLLDAILEFAERLVPYDSANIRLIEDGWIRFRGQKGYEKYGLVDWLMSYRERVDALDTLIETLDNHDPVIVPDTDASPVWKRYPETAHIKSFVSLPIVSQDETIGLLSLDSETPLSYTREDAERLQPLADAAAVAIKNAQLVAQLESQIAQREEAEAALRQSVSDKEVLLRELHHRVKNNLTMIAGLINLQGASFTSKEEFVSHLHDRIHSIALVHEKMYQGESFDTIELGDYVHDLLGSMEVLQRTGRITLRIEIPQGVFVHLEQAIPIGLVLNELVTNSIKYAVTEGGTIGIEMTEQGDTYLLHVWDTGPGVADPEGASAGSLGLVLVRNLAQQVGGEIRFYSDAGFHVEIRITKDALGAK